MCSVVRVILQEQMDGAIGTKTKALQAHPEEDSTAQEGVTISYGEEKECLNAIDSLLLSRVKDPFVVVTYCDRNRIMVQ